MPVRNFFHLLWQSNVIVPYNAASQCIGWTKQVGDKFHQKWQKRSSYGAKTPKPFFFFLNTAIIHTRAKPQKNHRAPESMHIASSGKG
ncbi:hypothetical protein DUNSADRAFT_7630 [Dunaliella salina]|uniref:Encoded protein n=1 Tax=Dunaliella salina TaxID=3046 RepID=A0ABQ7GL48_DUNSA|nr:hypothetical protein DUNSADRAFT_7630 [Dunaliella salina]|eukprot:KAF5835268.1 hypothetical protein DUNSADRAFT_7630 [Dunaliella salina]